MRNRDYIAAYLARRPHLGLAVAALPSRANAARDNSSITTTTTAEATKAEATTTTTAPAGRFGGETRAPAGFTGAPSHADHHHHTTH